MLKNCFLGLVAATLLVSASTGARATTYTGSVSLVDTTEGSTLGFKSNPKSFSFNLAPGKTLLDKTVAAFTTKPTNFGSGKEFNDNILATFTFTAPSEQTTVDGSKVTEYVYKADGHFASSGWLSFDTNYLNVAFSTGDTLAVQLGTVFFNNSNGSADAQQLSANFTNTTPVSEPASMAVLGAGLFGVGMLRRKRQA